MRLLVLILGFFVAKAAFADTVVHGVKPGFKAGDKNGVVEYHTGLLKRPKGFAPTAVLDLKDDPACASLPASFDLLDLVPAVVPSIKDQGQCGSCWAFSKTGALESWTAVSAGKSLNLAEQELVSDDGQNYGCDGGLLQSKEYQFSHGQGLEADFPYTASDARAKSIAAASQLTFPAYEVVAGSGAVKIKNTQCALVKYHTVPWITISADDAFAQASSTDGAVLTSCNSGQTNHAIGITGWKTVNGKVYFHAKNSWGTSWGQKGYSWIALGCDSFGDEIAFLPASPAVPTPTPSPTPDPSPTPSPFKCQAQLDAVSNAVEGLKACVK